MQKAIVAFSLFLLIAIASGTVMGVVFSDFLPWNAKWGWIVRIDSSNAHSRAIGVLVEAPPLSQRSLDLIGIHVRSLSTVDGNQNAIGLIVEAAGRVKNTTKIFGGTVYLDGVFEDCVCIYAGDVFVRSKLLGPVRINAGVITIEPSALITNQLRYSGKLVNRADPSIVAIEDLSSGQSPFDFWIIISGIAILFLLGTGLLMSILFTWHLFQTTSYLIENPMKSATLGGVALLAFPFAMIISLLLAVTVIGLTAAGIIVIAYVIGIILSVIYVGTAVGRVVAKMLNQGREPSLTLAMFVGVPAMFFW